MQGTIGEIRLFAGDFAPKGWAICSGQTMKISTNAALFSVIGNTYGGDGKTYFCLPNFSGRTPIHVSPKYKLGSKGGLNKIVFDEDHMPTHTHKIVTAKVKCRDNNLPAAGRVSSPKDAYPSNSGSDFSYASAKNLATDATATTKYFHPNAVQAVSGTTGTGKPMENMMPSLAINFIICVYGQYPTYE